jgi:micrococcal nuclease
MLRRFALALVFVTQVSFAQLVGKVVSVADGDTFTMLINNERIRIRLHGIDCPEKGQDFSNAAKDFLSNYVFSKTVSVKEMDVDRYGRTIGMVVVDSVNVMRNYWKLDWRGTIPTMIKILPGQNSNAKQKIKN